MGSTTLTPQIVMATPLCILAPLNLAEIDLNYSA